MAKKVWYVASVCSLRAAHFEACQLLTHGDCPGTLPRAMIGTRSLARIEVKTEEDFEPPATPKYDILLIRVLALCRCAYVLWRHAHVRATWQRPTALAGTNLLCPRSWTTVSHCNLAASQVLL